MGLSIAVGATVSAEVDLGRSLFETGNGRDGREMGAQIGGSGGVRMRGAAVACAGCHGQDGRGGGEGWLRAPDLRWFTLSGPHGRARADGSNRPAYDREDFARAVRFGMAPDGIELDTVMPRYDLADDEIDALRAHLRTLDRGNATPPPALVVLMPRESGGPAARLLEGMQRCPSAAQPAHLPALTVLRYDRISDALVQLQAMEEKGEIAAVFAPYLVSVEADYAQAPLHRSLPTLLPVAFAGVEPLAGSGVLFRLPSIGAQARALLLALPLNDEMSFAIYRQNDDGMPEEALQQVLSLAESRTWRTSIVGSMDEPGADAPIVLVLAPLTAPPAGRDVVGVHVLVPALFMEVAAAEAWHARGATVRVGFPYPPRSSAAPGRWIGPEQAWIALACELLARLPSMPRDAVHLDEWRGQVKALPDLQLAGWFELPARSGSDDDVRRVEVRGWPLE